MNQKLRLLNLSNDEIAHCLAIVEILEKIPDEEILKIFGIDDPESLKFFRDLNSNLIKKIQVWSHT